jgi:hypothetical protein
MTDGAASSAYLRLRLAALEAGVRAAVDRRRAVDPDPDDRFRGLYISDAEVERLLAASADGDGTPVGGAPDQLAEIEAWADRAVAEGSPIRLRDLAGSFGLDALDVELLLIAMAPDLDPRFERLYAYLQDDVSRRRAGVGLALELCTGTAAPTLERTRLGPDGALLRAGLLVIDDLDRPFLTRSLTVPDRVTAHLLGHDAPDPLLQGLLATPVRTDLPGVDELARAIPRGVGLTYLRERAGAAARSFGATAFANAGVPVVSLDLLRLAPEDDLRDVAAVAVREALLLGGGLVAGPIDPVAERDASRIRRLAEVSCPVVLFGGRAWDPGWSADPPLLLDIDPPTAEQRELVWRAALDGDSPADLDPAGATMQFRLSPEQVYRAAVAGRLRARAADRPVRAADLQAGARAQNAAGLERLARRIEPEVAWDDLVLPEPVVGQLRELAARARLRERVFEAWGLGRSSTKGRGVTALFAGESGTGKTMSAEVVARSLGLDLYVIDLSTVVDKYIGETEKNLDRIFTEADRVNGVLLFDEADALFGKRSEVSDARDRYANVEVAYLLQRIESFDGLAVLTTNLRANVDEAFTRRLDAVVDFPMPEQEDRFLIWQRNLPPALPRTDDLDLAFLASAFRISGGNIRNVCVTAAFLAADEDRPVEMADLIRGTEREYRKLGHLTVESEFGPYFPLVASGVDGRS